MNTKNYLKFNLFTLTAFVVLLAACKKDRVERVYEKQIVGTKGIYVLCEGSMGADNSTISYYDIEKKTVVQDYYMQVNGVKLGETANDLKVYGTKMYCVITGIQGAAKSFVEVMDAATAKTIKRISFNNGTEGKMPRTINFYNGKAYVASYDGTISRIDTATFAIDELQLKNGANNAGGLEGSTIANGKLYVTNSSHPSFPNGFKDKVTVINLATFTKVKDITVTFNPLKIAAAENGDVMVVSWGNYADINASLQKISSVTDAVTGTYTPNVGAINILNNQAFLAVNWGSQVAAFNVATGVLGASPITDATAISNAYAITNNPFDQNFVVSDADYAGTNNKAFVFGKDGKLKYSFSTGPLPQIAAFNYKYAFVSKN